MTRRVCRGTVAAVALSLLISQPQAFGSERPTRVKDTREKIVKVLKDLGKIFGISIFEDMPGPPKP